MIKIVLFFLLPLTLFGSKILSYNIYDRTDRVDVMITFDTPYDGAISKSINDSKITVKLQDASIESSKIKKLTSEYIEALSISPMSTYVQIVASVPSNINFIASKTSDAYGLRLRFTKTNPNSKQTDKKIDSLSSKEEKTTTSLTLPTKKEEDLSQSYYIVIAVLIAGIIILLMLKKKVTPNTLNKNSNWLLPQDAKKANKLTKIESNDVSIRFQKTLDENNSVVMLDFAQQSYLVLMGNNNVLLDRFTDNQPTTQEDFETILQDKHQALEDFLNTPKPEPMESYRNKASSISYEV